MPAGVSGFVRERLIMAREARGLRQNEVANLIGRSAATISKWESGIQNPDPSAIPDLCTALAVFPKWFFTKPPIDDETCFFRSLVSELESFRARARARLGFIAAIADLVTEYVDLPETNLPLSIENDDFKYLRDNDIEAIAEEIRDHWGVADGPIDDLLLLIENSGVIVGEDMIGSVKLDGISCWSKTLERPLILLAKDKKSGSRRRYDAAHELSHLLLHRNISKEDLLENFRLIENQAMHLAGAILMPAKEFRNSVYSISLESLADLKEVWGVSVGAMIKRLSNIGEISPQSERRLWQYYSKRRWRSGEPNETKIKIETPENMKSSVEMLLSDGSFSSGALLREIGLSAKDVCMLCGVSNAFFEKEINVERHAPVSKIDKRILDQSNVLIFPRKR